MKVLLLSTYDLGHQPFGLASPAAWLRAAGHDVRTTDLAVSPFPAAAAGEADCVAIHLPMHTATRLAGPVIARVKGLNPRARLVAYGLYAPLCEEWLGGLGLEALIGGEYEAELVRAVEGQSGTFVPLERLAFRTPERDTLPDLERYAHVRFGDERRVTGYTEASRGCKHLCRHCPVVPVYEGRFRVVEPDVVLEDIRRQVAQGARHITFGDPDFFNGPRHALRVVEAVHAAHPDVSYDVTIKIEHLLRHRDLLPALASTGCAWVTSAAESTEDHVLEKLAKGHTRADFLEALAVTRAAGLRLSPTFVAFTPWSTRAGYMDLLRVLLEQDLVEAVAPIQLALRLLIPRGSRLLELEELRPSLDGFDPAALLWRWRHPDPGMDRLAERVFVLVARGQKQNTERRALFEAIWIELHGAAPPEDRDRISRTTIPYLEEPWYC